jgi:predicted secreted protein
MVPWDADSSTAVALGDVDGDGDVDALIGNEGQPNRLLLNDGSGVFTDATSQLPGFVDATRAVALGDVDGDGDLDALIGNAGQTERLHLNDGSGVFADATSQLPGFVDNTWAVALGDVDGDGDLDALIGNWSGFTVPIEQNRLYLNNGSGVFTDAPAQLPAMFGYPRAVVLGDVDGDGDLDALIGNAGGFFVAAGQNRLLVNNGSGVFADATVQLPAIPSQTTAIALGDVDGDGDLDALIGQSGYAPQQDRLYLNDGSGLFTDATAQLPAILGQTTAVDLGDVDGDGDLDALVGATGQNRLYRNDGSGVFTNAAGPLPAILDEARAVSFGDVDGDGDLDVFVGNYGQPNRLFLNDGSGVFTDATAPIPGVVDDTYAVALGDVDGDGDLDALLGQSGYGPQQDRLILNDGSGVFADATAQLPAILGQTTAVALGDVDVDGDLDALIGNYFQQHRLYLNNGSGVFTNSTGSLPAILQQTTAVALGDVDGDGDLDARIGNVGQDRLYVNGGSGAFADATSQLPASFDSTWAVALGDVDGDGDLDALIGNHGQNGLQLNGGSGVFADATSQLPALVGNTQAVALGDADGDGDLDALVGNGSYSAEQNRLYLNDGSGTFADATSQLPAVVDHTRAVALGDVEGDGDLDALIGNYEEQALLYLNDGSGVFADATSQLPEIAEEIQAIALGDLDGDGDLDAWIGNDGQDRLLMNPTRQLAWRGIPRIGKPLTLDLFGPPSGAWLLAFSLGTASIPLPPLGTVRLNPTSLFVLVSGPLDAQGRASVTFAVPQNPALVGATLDWQALVGAPFYLTNLEITTFTNF